MRRPDLPLALSGLPLTLPALAALFSAVALVLILATAPLSLALAGRGPAAGLSAAAVTGTVWNGRLTDAAFRGLRLGDMRVGVAPLSLITGRVRLAFQGGVAQGTARLGPRRIELLDMDAVVPLAVLAPSAGLEGQLGLRGFDLDLRGGECQRAAGEVLLNQLRLAGIELAGLLLAGTPACSGADLLVPLRGQAEGVDVDVDLRISPAGAYQAQLILRTTRPEVEAALAAVGYRRTLEGYETTFAGQLGVS